MPVAEYECEKCGARQDFECDIQKLPDTVIHNAGDCNGKCRFKIDNNTVRTGLRIPK